VGAQNGGAQSISAEVFCIHACVEGRTTEINGIRSAFDCRVQRFGRAGGTEQFR